MVLTLIAWAAIPASVSKVSYDLQTKTWHSSSTLPGLIRCSFGTGGRKIFHHMKKLLFLTVSFLLSIAAQAQKDVTRFLGIPVDGTKFEKIRKFTEKRFRSKPYESDVLMGEFNGRNVEIHVVTNNNKVYRIVIVDANTVDERSIQIRFNDLCRQFENNDKYIVLQSDRIPDSEDISYEIIVHKKQYQAAFCQKSTGDNVDLKKSVWFMITHLYGKYGIAIFYDNEYNRADGEDL